MSKDSQSNPASAGFNLKSIFEDDVALSHNSIESIVESINREEESLPAPHLAQPKVLLATLDLKIKELKLAGEYDCAYMLLKHINSFLPAEFYIKYNLAQISNHRGSLDEALKLFEDSSALAAKGNAAEKAAACSSMGTIFRKKAESSTGQESESCYRRMIKAYNEAIKSAKDANLSKSRIYEWIVEKAIAHKAVGEYERAIEACNTVRRPRKEELERAGYTEVHDQLASYAETVIIAIESMLNLEERSSARAAFERLKDESHFFESLKPRTPEIEQNLKTFLLQMPIVASRAVKEIVGYNKDCFLTGAKANEAKPILKASLEASKKLMSQNQSYPFLFFYFFLTMDMHCQANKTSFEKAAGDYVTRSPVAEFSYYSFLLNRMIQNNSSPQIPEWSVAKFDSVSSNDILQAIKEYSNHTVADRAFILTAMGDAARLRGGEFYRWFFEKAIVEIDKQIQDDSSSMPDLFLLTQKGLACLGLERVSEACEIFRSVIAHPAAPLAAFEGLADILSAELQKGDMEKLIEAASAYDKFLSSYEEGNHVYRSNDEYLASLYDVAKAYVEKAKLHTFIAKKVANPDQYYTSACESLSRASDVLAKDELMHASADIMTPGSFKGMHDKLIAINNIALKLQKQIDKAAKPPASFSAPSPAQEPPIDKKQNKLKSEEEKEPEMPEQQPPKISEAAELTVITASAASSAPLADEAPSKSKGPGRKRTKEEKRKLAAQKAAEEDAARAEAQAAAEAEKIRVEAARAEALEASRAKAAQQAEDASKEEELQKTRHELEQLRIQVQQNKQEIEAAKIQAQAQIADVRKKAQLSEDYLQRQLQLQKGKLQASLSEAETLTQREVNQAYQAGRDDTEKALIPIISDLHDQTKSQQT